MASPVSPWEDPQCPFRVEATHETLDQIRIAVVDAFYSLPRGGLEIGGLLLGKFEGQVLRVSGWAAMECEHLTGPSFVLSAKDESALQAQLADLGKQVVGWFHSHTRTEILFSPKDLALQDRFFPAAHQIAMVLRPAHLQPLQANYFFRDQKGTLVPGAKLFVVEATKGEVVSKPHREATVTAAPVVRPDAARVAAKATPRAVLTTAPPPKPAAAAASAAPPRVEPPKPVAQPLPPPPVPPIVPPPVEAPAAPPMFAAGAPPRPVRQPVSFMNKLARLTGTLAILATGAAAYLTRDSWMPKEPEPLRLQASDVEGKLLIRWNPVRDGQTGELHITDGGTNTDLQLDALEMRRGIYLFTRHGVNDTVRLKVGSREDTTSFAGPLPSPPGESAADLQSKQEALEREKKMKTNLANQSARTRQLEQKLRTLKNQMDQKSGR